MKMRLITFVALGVAFAAHCAFALDAMLMADGSVRFGPDGSYSLKPVLFLPEWKSTTSAGGYAVRDPGVATFRLESGGTVIADATTTISQLDGGKSKVVFSVTPRKDTKTISCCCTVGMPIAEVDGRPWGIAGKEGAFCKPEKGIAVARGRTSFVSFPSGAKGPLVRVEAAEPFDCLIQDSRKWGDTYSIRAGDLSARVLKAGEKISFECVVSAGEPVSAIYQKQYVVEAGADWVPIVEHRDILEGSALDFSKAGFTDAPAGKHGWVRNVGGHFEFEGLPGRPQRFYGVNLCFSANFPDHELADRLVTRLKRFGYNAIRIHHHDGETVKGSEDGLTLNQDSMDRLDYLVSAAIREGLYITTDMYVSRGVKWRHVGIDRNGFMEKSLFKALCAVYDPAFENWAAYSKNFMEHVNKYTGRRYADEPALSLVSLVNEGGFFMGWTRGVSDDPRIADSWRAWIKARREADPSFAEGIDSEMPPKNYWDAKSRPFVDQWCAGLETKMVARMKAYLRSLGVKALITNDNNGQHYVARNGMASEYDYIDDHFYVDHPSFLEKSWQLPSRCPNVNQLLGSKPVVPVDRDFAFVKGKPFTITEWNFSGPGRYRGVGGILTGATAALRDMDGLWRFAYSHSRDRLGDSDIRPPSYFDLSADQLSLASDRASICLFLRRDIEPGAEGALKMDRARGSFTIDTPRTVGGFAPEGAIEAGALKASLSGAPATVCVHSLDGEPVAKSGRMLLTHLTDVQGEGGTFADESMKILLKWGRRPLARNGSAAVSLALESPSGYEVWELAANGARVRKVDARVSGGRLEFTASISGPDGARMMYEIVKRNR